MKISFKNIENYKLIGNKSRIPKTKLTHAEEYLEKGSAMYKY